MKEITILQIIEATGGRLQRGSEAEPVKRVVIDSRNAKKGDLFVAIVGESQDGHIYAKNAAQAGCRVFLMSHEAACSQLGEVYPDAVIIAVPNTVKGLQELAGWYLRQFDVRKLAVTGSTGKTTTKEMLYAVLSQRYKTVRNLWNFNNEIGLPLTVFQVEEDTEAVVFEMGMSSFGEIRLLADLVRPEVAIITNVGTSHIEFLKTRENILKAKMEITDFFGDEDTLIVNSNSDFLDLKSLVGCMREKNKENPRYSGNFDIITAGEGEKADCLLSNRVNRGDEGISFQLTYKGETQDFRLPLLGEHNAWNAMLAVTAGAQLGVSLSDAARGLAQMEPEERRLCIEERNGVRLIDDTYNASPDSMMAAIDVLTSVGGKRTVAILADILEMGDMAAAYHKSVGEYASKKKVDVVISIGQNARYIAEGAKEASDGAVRSIYHETKEPLIAALSQIIKPGDVVLVKGSNGMKMTEVVDAIRSL